MNNLAVYFHKAMRRKSIFRAIIFSFTTLFCTPYLTAQTPDWQWVNTTSGMYYEIGFDLATDHLGNIYSGGFYNDTSIQIGPFTLTNAGNGSDIFIARYTLAGSLVWAKSFGSKDEDELESVAADENGNIYLTGVYNGPSISFDTITLNHSAGSGLDFFITKMDSSGNVLWAKSFGSNGNDKVWALAIDPSSNGGVYAAGEFDSDSIKIGQIILLNNGTIKLFLAKLDLNGNVVWAKQTGGSGGARPQAISLADSNSIYITGDFFNFDVEFGSYTLTPNGLTDVFVTKYDQSGTVQWSKAAIGSGQDNGKAIGAELTGNKNIYIGGGFNSDTLYVDSLYLTGNSGDLFLLKYDANGNILWTKNYGGSGIDYLTSIDINKQGEIFASGTFFSDTLTLGSTQLINSNMATQDCFIANLDTNGNFIWTKGITGPGNDIITALASTTNQTIFATGYYDSPDIYFDSTSLTNTGFFDYFTAKLSPNMATVISSSENPEVMLFPNPFSNNIHIRINQKILDVKITTIQGQPVSFTPVENNYASLTLAPCSYGIYVITIYTGTGVYVKKMIKLASH